MLTTQDRMASAAVLPASTFMAFFTTCGRRAVPL